MERQTNGEQGRYCPVDELAVFAGVGEQSREALKAVGSESLNYSAAEIIYRAGSSAQHFYIVRDGYVKLFKTTLNGKDQIIRVVKPGELFGFDGLVDVLYNHSAVPLKYATVCRIPVGRLRLLGEQRSEVERLIMVRCIKELQHADERLLELGAKRSAERLAGFLLSWCEDAPAGKWTPLVLSRLEIAQLLGLTIETISRLFAHWKREDVVEEMHQAIRILDANRLNQIAGGSE
ncbi:Crp/Fnr family transcriptional regulator [Candidatus Thiothrix sp. Deng01]|uniref:Crp/Fnr family transcriptional regulator n=1 Tax=Candidatus Thiothrix phosphatis TaxID=3112415 RepID=A0ABU6D0Z8_9GAMM|nr:Crp/Fnr family transcriptional regulator [Candidatus Thiothrix sp. Deng01]MEB4592715.1 Crp/Fnr family transcriptional regulator [Candidatus Thiothrix sp. Deng01]